MRKTADIINDRATTVVDAVRGDQVGAYRWIKNLVAETVKDYRGRFLHELIQNGFDAHPTGTRAGKIAVHFHEDEGEHGVLYVANGGNPLSESNFLRMASLGDSDKPIGIGIGNKGVGFKSVFQVCDAPQVYSACGTDDRGFSGFSFRFGTLEDLNDFLSPDDPLRAKLESELSLSLLTVPLDGSADVLSPAVADLRREGFVTVLRLPASTDRAAMEILERIERLLTSPSPVMLFLDRLKSLSIKTSTTSQPTLLTREQLPEDGFSRVILNDADTYLLFEGVVGQDDLATALREAVDEGALDQRWLEWNTPANVSVAVGEGWPIPNPGAFTFLPMGVAANSPLGGHINAPFVTDFARLGLDLDQPVNRLMLRRIAEVCVDGAGALIRSQKDPGAVVDLLAWDPGSVEWVSDAANRLRGSRLDDLIRLPSIGNHTWERFSQLKTWPDLPCEVLTVDRLVEAAHAKLIDTALVDAKRLERLATHGGSLLPSPTTAADWVELVASSLAGDGAPFTTWRAFYDDLPLMFSTGDPLYGKRILLAESGELVPADQPVFAGSRATRRGQRAVYFAPKVAGTEDDDAVDTDVDISPPASLARRIVFLHKELDWYDGPSQTPGRKFLQDHRLTRQFRTASLLAHLGQLMAANPSNAVKRDSLDFAFRLFATNPTRHSKELADVGLAVPTAAGEWVDATLAHFSKGWDVPGANELSELVAGAPGQTSELAGIAERLIVEPVDIGRGSPNIPKWTSFLRVLGVTATLPIHQAPDSRRMYGQSLTADNIAGDGAPSSLPAAVVEQWKRGITSTGNGHHPWTYFTTKDPVYWFAGQAEIGNLSARLRGAYARLLVQTVPFLKQEHRYSTWNRDRSGGWSTTVETPLSAFLTGSDWVPNAIPNENARLFRTPNESWYVGVEDKMAASYSPLVDSRLRALMDSAEVGEKQWKTIGFLDWTDPEDAAVLIDHLTDLFSGGDIPETASDHFRTSLAAAWNAVGDPDVKTRPTLDGALLVEIQGRLALASKEETSSSRLFVAGTRDQSSSTRLVRELGWPLVSVDGADRSRLNEVAEVLRNFWQDDVQVSSDWDLEVLVDDGPWEVDDRSRRLVEEIPWTALLVAASLRFPRASGMRIGRQLDRILDELNRVRIVRADRVAVASDSGNQALPARLHGVLPIAGDIPTLLAESQQNPPTWEEFETLMQATLELLGQERFKAEVSLTIRDLSTGADHPISRPTAAEFAEVLQVSEGQVAEVESAVFGAIGGIVERLRHVAPIMWGEVGLEAFSESQSTTFSRDDILHVLTELCGEESTANGILEAASDTGDANELRLRLGIGISEFNAVRALHFPSLALVDNGAAHADEFDLRRRQRQADLVDWARHSRVDRFDSFELQPDWPGIRDLGFLAPDPDWATTLDEVDPDLLDARIDEMMSEAIGPRRTGATPLPDYDTVRTANGRPLRTRIVEARRVVRAWCRRSHADVPAAWEVEDFDVELRNRLDEIGALDFRNLSDEALAAWLSRIGVWPSGMVLSTDPATHGLTHSDLYVQETADAAAKAEKARAARRVQFQGVPVDLDSSMSDLVDRVSRFLESQPESLQSAYRTSALGDLPAARRRAGSSGDAPGNKKGGGVSNRPSNEQTSAIGLVGEMVALHWLENRDPSGVVDASCWKSGNCRFVIDGATGDDSLGYDFEVPRRGGSVMYEVKATTGDAGMIELGETEVRCAQQFARSDRWRLLIVEDVFSLEPRIHMLPNPFRPDSRSLFSFVGNSVRLRFNLQ